MDTVNVIEAYLDRWPGKSSVKRWQTVRWAMMEMEESRMEDARWRYKEVGLGYHDAGDCGSREGCWPWTGRWAGVETTRWGSWVTRKMFGEGRMPEGLSHKVCSWSDAEMSNFGGILFTSLPARFQKRFRMVYLKHKVKKQISEETEVKGKFIWEKQN